MLRRLHAFKRKCLARSCGRQALILCRPLSFCDSSDPRVLSAARLSLRDQSESLSSSSFEVSVALAIREYSNIPAPMEFPKR